jgi:hypothetical protein
MKKKTALITGATSGIGKAYAKRYAAMGYDLILTGRRKQVITALATELERAYGITAAVIIAELATEKGIRAVLTAIKNTRRLAVLVNNAGYGVEGLFKDLPVKEHLNMVAVHVNASLRFLHAALPRMVEHRSGTIINVASLGAFTPAPINGVYGGTKALLVILTETLHMEVRRYGVRVQALCPGFTHTDFHRKMGIGDELNRNRMIFWMMPDRVVDISLRSLEKGKVVCIPGFINRILFRIARLLPRRLYYWMTEELYSRYIK